MFKREGTQDQLRLIKVDVSQEERGSAANRVEIGLRGSIGSKRGVVAVKNGEVAAAQQRAHRASLLCINSNGYETLPFGTGGGDARAGAIQPGCGQVKRLDDGRCRDTHLSHGRRGRDDWDDLDRVGSAGEGLSRDFNRDELVDGEALRLKDAIQAFEREGATAIEEVRDMRLAKSGELREAGSGQNSDFDAAH